MSALVITENVINSVNTYGIKISFGEKTFIFPSISEYKNDVIVLMGRLQDTDIAAVHINDIVRDYIMELAYNRLKQNNI